MMEKFLKKTFYLQKNSQDGDDDGDDDHDVVNIPEGNGNGW